jgi:hypothetical protein
MCCWLGKRSFEGVADVADYGMMTGRGLSVGKMSFGTVDVAIEGWWCVGRVATGKIRRLRRVGAVRIIHHDYIPLFVTDMQCS